MNALTLRYFFLLFGLFGMVVACDDDDNFSISEAIGFGAVSGQVTESEASGKRITFYTNTEITEPVTLTVKITNIGSVAYGTDYTTIPAAVDNTITFTINPGETDYGFLVYPVARPGLSSSRKINFEITDVSGGNAVLTETASRYYELVILREVVNYTFESCSVELTKFTEQSPASALAAKSWVCTSFGYSPVVNTYTGGIEANAYGKGTSTTPASNAYLITKIDAGSSASLLITMDVMSYYTGPGALSVKYSENYSGTGDPEAAGVTWITLKTASGREVDADLPAVGSRTWRALSGFLENTANKQYYIALQYKGATSASASNWRIDNIKVVGQN